VHADDAFFQSRVWHAVESLINELQVPGVRTLITRLGLVIGADALMDRMLRLSRCYLGATMGDGTQRIGWIARRDMVRAFMYLLGNRQHQGVFNLVTPRPITAAQLTHGIARCVDRPVLFRVPGGLLHLLLGELASNFLTSADAMPARLQMARFHWSLPDFDLAIRTAASDLGHRCARAAEAEQRESALKSSATAPVMETVSSLRKHRWTST
jgi:NAD dependent epimerase/dehydratase family enzyme